MEWLYLKGTNISDAGLVHLEGLNKLYNLDLSRTRVGDAGLVHLRRLPRLSMLDLASTKVTKGGVKELQIALGEGAWINTDPRPPIKTGIAGPKSTIHESALGGL